MSPLWRDEIGAYIAPRRLYLVRIKRGLHPQLARDEVHEIVGNAGGWDAALSLFEQHLKSGHWSNAAARLVLANHWVRYGIVPWSDTVSAPSERLAHARELLAGVYGDSMSNWTVALSLGPPGAPALASAIPTSLLGSLRELAARYRQKLVAVEPHLTAAFNTWKSVLPHHTAAWFVTVEEGSLAALRMCAQGIDRVHAVRIGPDWARELKRLQTFGRLARASPADGKVYVDLPISLRALRPDLVGDLEWLDEAMPPLTTLHHLEYLRRRAA